MRYCKKAIILTVLLAASLYNTTAYAADLFYYSLNNIRYYNDDIGCSITSRQQQPSGQLLKAVDYKNREVFTEGELKAIQDNSPFYKKSAETTGIPWEMIAVVHKRESGLARENPNNQGVYQFYHEAGQYTPGPIDDVEFQRQTDKAAAFLLEKAAAGGKADALKSSDDNAVKYTFFAYNGIASVYKDQAKRLGFTDDQAENGEGSPYVMNQADKQRDPEENPTGWGQIKRDGGQIEYPANLDHGAFVMYAALRGETSLDGCSDSGDINGDGLTEEQARRFMMAYGENKNNFSANHTGSLWGFCNGGGSNCVTFSYFFNNAFTDLPADPGDGNGMDIVQSLAAKGASTGSEPRIFSTFSLDANNGVGHTGIVLGKTKDGSLIVGHASCSHMGIGKGDGTYEGGGAGFIMIGKPGDGNTWLSGIVAKEFAYPGKVDVEKIKQFIDGKL